MRQLNGICAAQSAWKSAAAQSSSPLAVQAVRSHSTRCGTALLRGSSLPNLSFARCACPCALPSLGRGAGCLRCAHCTPKSRAVDGGRPSHAGFTLAPASPGQKLTTP